MEQELNLENEKTEVKSKQSIEIISNNYAELSKYVTKTRVYPSAIDGMKAVHRRLVYATRIYNKLTKSATLVGETSKYHPHGTGPVYDALVMMACEFNKFPIYNKKGNFGGLGHPAAAERYTEACLSDLGRLMYLELIDYADMVEGDAGYLEPKYLPALLPYSLLVGSTGIPVGMPVPRIPPLNSIELIDFYIDRLNKVENPKYPKIDEGECVLDFDYEETMVNLIKTGAGKAWYKGIINRETTNRFVISDNIPSADIHKILKKLSWYVDNEIVDYIDESSSEGERHVLILNDFNKLPVDEFLRIAQKAFKSSLSYKIIVEYESSAVYCGLDYIVDKSINYLRKCSIRKWTDTKSKVDSRLIVLQAIEKLKELDLIKNFSSMTDKDVIAEVVNLGYEEWVGKEVLNKPMRYLTKSYLQEIEDLKVESDNCQMYIDNPEEYLLTLYYKLREMMIPLYSKRKHSMFQNEIDELSNKKATLKGDRIELSSKGEVDFDNNLIVVNRDGTIDSYYSNKVADSIMLDTDKVAESMTSDRGKYLVVLTGGCSIYASELSEILKGNGKRFKPWDGLQDYKAYITDKDTITAIKGNNREELKITDYIKSRLSKPVWLGEGYERLEV